MKNKHKFDINEEAYYQKATQKLDERTKARLTEMADCGMEDLGIAEFGFKGVMSGLYIENVWSFSDEKFKQYMDWAKSLIKKNQIT